MENISKIHTGIVSALLGWFAPVQTLVCCALACVSVDFATGLLADRKRSLQQSLPWRFESTKAWRTIRKLVFICGGILLTSLIDRTLAPLSDFHLANLFTGFVCGVELWSYLENAAVITDHKAFRIFRTRMKSRFENTLTASNDDLRKSGQ